MKLLNRLKKIEKMLAITNEFDAASFDDWFDWWQSLGKKIDRPEALDDYRRRGFRNSTEMVESLMNSISGKTMGLPKPRPGMVRLSNGSCVPINEGHKKFKFESDQKRHEHIVKSRRANQCLILLFAFSTASS